MRILRAVMIFAFSVSATFLSAKNHGFDKVLRLNDLKPGMSCYCLTVLKGQVPEKVKLKIVGDTRNPFFAEKILVLAEMQGNMPVIAGMSGSPVYCGGKLLGALSMDSGGPFPLKHALAGITPIGYIRDQQGSLGKKSAVGAGNIDKLRPIAIPLSVGEATSAQIGRLNREMPNENFVFVAGGIGGQDLAAQRLGTIAPGDSITMALSTGAVVIEGTCTVTEVTEKKFSACGHQLLGEGAIEFPAFRSSIAATFQSSFSSFKIEGKILEPVGTIVYDNAFAVEGVREIRPNVMVPVDLSVTVDSDHYDYRFNVLRHKFYTSAFIESGARFLLEKLWAENRFGTARLVAKIHLKGVTEAIEIYDASLITKQRMQVGFMEGYADPWQILGKFQQTLSAIQQSEWDFDIGKVEISLDIWSGNRILVVDSFAVLDANDKPTEEVRAGDKITVIIGMRNRDSTQKLVKKFVMEIPRDLNLVKPENETDVALPISLYIMSGTKYKEMDPKKLPKVQPDSAKEFLRVLRLNQRDPSEMFAVLILPPEYRSVSRESAIFPELKLGIWNSVSSVDFLRDKTASESRVICLPLGAPLKDAVVSFTGMRELRLMLK